MTKKDRAHYFPSLSQAVLAALFGVGIGLFISYVLDKPESPEQLVAIESESKVKNIAALGNLAKNKILDASKNIHLWPTLTNRTNILLMGVDSNGRNTKRFENTRSDTMILASIDPFNKKVGLISIPRDSRVRIPDKDNLDKINAAHALGGPELAVRTVESALTVPIDHYVVIDRVGLKDVFKILGPVQVNVEKRMRYRDRASGLNIDLKPGLQELDEQQVEEYLRFRYDQKGDIGRIARQQWFLRQASQKLKEPAVLLKIPELIQFASNYIVTDMSVQDMTALVGFGKDIGSESIETATLPGEGVTINGGSYWVVDPEASALVLKRLAGVSPSVQRIADATHSRKVVSQEDEDLEHFDSLSEMLSQSNRSLALGPNNDSFQTMVSRAYSSERPYSVVIRYPRGQEETARDFQDTLAQAGYRVRSLVRCRLGDCQHEKIELNSFRADENVSDYLKKRFPEFKSWALVMNPKHRTRTDLTIQLTPDTSPLMPHETVRATFDYSIHGFGPGEIKSSRPSRSPRFKSRG